MKGKNRLSQFCVATVGALGLGAVLAAGFDAREGGNAKQQTPGQKAAVKTDKMAPAAKAAMKGGVADKAVKMGDGSVSKQ